MIISPQYPAKTHFSHHQVNDHSRPHEMFYKRLCRTSCSCDKTQRFCEAALRWPMPAVGSLVWRVVRALQAGSTDKVAAAGACSCWLIGHCSPPLACARWFIPLLCTRCSITFLHRCFSCLFVRCIAPLFWRSFVPSRPYYVFILTAGVAAVLP